MQSLDIDRLDWVNVVYNTFFILLNQIILVAMTFICGIDGKLGWFNLPFAVLLLAINLWAISVWRKQGGTKAFKFYAKANVHCLAILALLGLAISMCGELFHAS